MDMKKFLCDFIGFLGLLLTCLLLANVSGCCFSGWDLIEELLELPSALCPLLTSTKCVVKDLFKTHTIEKDGPITSDLVTECLKCGRELSRAKKKRANELVKNGVSLEASTPAMLHFFSSSLPADVRKACDTSQEILAATRLLQIKVCSSCNVTPNTFLAFLEHQAIRIHEPGHCRPASVPYKPSKYRSADGSSNNPQRPEWGRRTGPFTRIATPRYADGIYSMPVAKSGRPLPNPRVLSTRLFYDCPIQSHVLTHLNMQWGQFVTHDMVFQVMEVTEEGGIQCCLGNGKDVLPAEMMNDKCIPICVPEDDPFYRPHGIRCLNFVRSVTTPRDDCSLGYAEQMNTVTSFLDGSQIYGSDKVLASKLRTKKGGRLRQDPKKGSKKKGYLPSVDDKWAVCDMRNSSDACYLAGDSRINQTPTLALLHTLLLREHNRVADTLSSMNPLWTDERIYQEARKIVVAEIQHITYQEWLPLNFGENYLRYYRVSPSGLYSRDYSEDVNPGVINSFGAAAFRFLHSIIPDSVMQLPSQCPAAQGGYQAAYLHKLSDHYFNPTLLESNSDAIDDMLRGIVALPAAESDPFVTREITNLLFKSHNEWGMDLIAMDIQRGRDHGLASYNDYSWFQLSNGTRILMMNEWGMDPIAMDIQRGTNHGLASYNDYREICGLTRARTFQDLAGEISQDRINTLSKVYECVDDVDLFVGGAMERDVHGSILGHTFHCIVAEQFYRTRVGDRFFYDNGEMPHSFTTDQLKQIKKASMARLICDNSGVQHIQRRAFEQESQYNPKYRCDDYSAIPYVDLTAWKQHGLDLLDL